MNWYYGVDGKQFGPVELPLLIQMVQEGKLQNHDLVWHAGMGEAWKEVGRVPELNVAPAPVSPAPPAVVPISSYTPPEPSISIMEEPAGFLENSEITRRARASLTGQWGLGIAVMLLQILLLGFANNILPFIAAILLTGPFLVGVSKVFLALARNQDTEVGKMFDGFQCFGNAMGTYLASMFFVFLWSLLFIIPGIIAGISYSMVYFILVDDPKREPGEAIDLSKEMMRGYKWQYFCLNFRFLGWILLSAIFTFGIGMLWVFPYMQTSYAHFYEMVRKNYMEQVSIS